MLTKEIRSKTFLTAKPVQQWLYSDGENGDLLFYIAQKYDLHQDEIYKKFAITVGDIILGFYKIEDTVPLLQQELGIDPRTAALLGADVLDFLAPLSDPNWQPPVEETEQQDVVIGNHAIEQSRSAPATPTSETYAIPINTAPAPQNTHIYQEPVSQPTYANNPPQPPVAIPNYQHQIPDTPPMDQQSPMPQSQLYQSPASPASPYDTPRPTPPAPPQSQPPHFHYEPVYQSTQPATRAPLSDVPTYQPPTQTPPPQPRAPLDPPRWGSG